MEQNYYEFFGISNNASRDEIKKAYLKLVKKYHPDTSKEKNADTMMSKINAIYTVLSDENKRAQYDLELSKTTEENQDIPENDNYEDVVNNYSEHEREVTEKLAIKQVILEELKKYDEILDTKKDILIGAYNGEYDLKGYYSIISEFLEISKQYIQDLQELKISADKYDLVEQINQLNETIENLQKEINDTPLSLIDAQTYIEKEFFLSELSEKYEQIELEKKNLARRWNYLCEKCYNNSIDAKDFRVEVNEILPDINELIDFCKDVEIDIYKFELENWKTKIRSIIDEISIILKIGDNSYNAHEYGKKFCQIKNLESFFNSSNNILDKTFKLDIQLSNDSYDNQIVNQVKNIDKLLEDDIKAIYSFAKNDSKFIKRLYDYENNWMWLETPICTFLSFGYISKRKKGEINVFKRYQSNGNTNVYEELNHSICEEDIDTLSSLYIILWQYHEDLIISFKCKAKEKLKSLEIYQSKLKKAFLIKSFFQITLTVIGAGLIFLGVKSFLQNMQDVNTFALYTISGIGIWMINITPSIIYNNYCDEHKNQVQELQEFMDLYNNSPLKSKSSLRPLKPY